MGPAYLDLADALVRDGVIGAMADLALRMSLVPLKMLIPNVAVGRLIGRGGFNVKRLMAESDAYIVCSREESPSRHAQPTERVLTVMASPHGQVWPTRTCTAGCQFSLTAPHTRGRRDTRPRR
jgi:hypothetical protein